MLHRTTQHTKPPQTDTEVPDCGHEQHRGSCPICQRRQLDRWRLQLKAAEELADDADGPVQGGPAIAPMAA